MDPEIRKIDVSETVKITDSVKIWSESSYLITSNRKRCAELIIKSDLDQNDIIDILISLHLILEVGLNIFYRYIVRAGLKKGIDEFEVIKNIDNINFIDKTILFIYNSKFDFGDGSTLSEATRYHSVINTLKSFSEMRNKLIHGHSISTILEEGGSRSSDLKKKISIEGLVEQTRRFRFILEGIQFYFDHLESGFTKHGKEQLKEAYLSDAFLPNLITGAKQEN